MGSSKPIAIPDPVISGEGVEAPEVDPFGQFIQGLPPGEPEVLDEIQRDIMQGYVLDDKTLESHSISSNSRLTLPIADSGAMPPVVVSNREEDSMNNEPSLSGKTIIGLINPPPDIRTIVDKTAGFVAKNGIEFENKIREKESNNPRFGFLFPTDPYHAYYNHKVREIREGRAEAPAPKIHLPEAIKEHVKKVEFIPTKPPPAYEYSADPATINAYELDLMRTTAIFVARNGRGFLTQLMTREARNYQFDFLKPAHSSFSYFTKLVEQYTKVIIPSNNILQQLESDKNTKKLLADVNYRVAWEKHQKTIKDKEEKEAEKERLAYASIDWHDFVVVQTVDFQPGDTSLLPGLCAPQDVGARILLEQRADQSKATNEVVAMDMDESDSEGEADIAHEVAQPSAAEFHAPLPPMKQKNIIVKDYDPRKATQQVKKPADKWLISPLTGERVHSDKMEEHMRYNTVDAQYKEDRDRLMGERGTEDPVLAPGSEIGRNLERFAERRTDIFGVGAAGAEQTAIGRKIGEEEQPAVPNKLIWDGSEESRDRHTRLAQSGVSIEQQIHELHKQHGYQQDTSKERIGAQPSRVASGANSIPVNPRGPAAIRPMPTSFDGPPTKKMRTEDDLEPENSWIEKMPAKLDLRVQLPVAADLNLDGSIIGIQLDKEAMVQDLKQAIQDKSTLAISKQKINFDGLFLKDHSSLAYYNVGNLALLTVQIKERGGKNK